MSKHTPGPWYITGSKTKYVESKIGNNLVQEVAAVGPTEQDQGYGQQQEANAYLISAAPDLLNALTVLVEVAEARGIPCDAARAAILKARGKE